MRLRARIDRLLRQASADAARYSDEDIDRALEEELERRLGAGATPEQVDAELARMEEEMREEMDW